MCQSQVAGRGSVVSPNVLSDILSASRCFSIKQAYLGADSTSWRQVMPWLKEGKTLSTLKGRNCFCLFDRRGDEGRLPSYSQSCATSLELVEAKLQMRFEII